jgi:hypothetical protein
MKKSGLSAAVKATPKRKGRMKPNTGYVPCLPEYEKDLSHLISRKKSLTMEEVFERERSAQKRQRVA